MSNKITKNRLFNDIKALIVESKSKIYSAVNSTMTTTYWNIGKRIVEEEQEGKERAEYGKALLKNLSMELTKEFKRGYSEDNLKNMRRFYLAYPKSETLSNKFKLSWSHYIFLTRITDKEERKFYELEAIQESLSVREIKRQFDSGLYQRLQLSLDKEKVKTLSEKGQIIESVDDLIKDLKIGKLKHQDIGQMMMYVNHYDRVEKQEDENPTVGIILCRDKSKALVEMTLPKDNNQIYASKYLTVLPDKEEFRKLLEAKSIEDGE